MTKREDGGLGALKKKVSRGARPAGMQKQKRGWAGNSGTERNTEIQMNPQKVFHLNPKVGEIKVRDRWSRHGRGGRTPRRSLKIGELPLSVFRTIKKKEKGTSCATRFHPILDSR